MPGKADPKRRRFKLLRSFTVADFVTLGNAASGMGSILFCLNFLENDKYEPYIYAAFFLLPLALLFDICDGHVARYRQNSSPYGSDLDSLADVISFAVAPAVLGFTLGLRGSWDCTILAFFVCCGVSRLARYNVTAETLADAKTGKVKYYQGFPGPPNPPTHPSSPARVGNASSRVLTHAFSPVPLLSPSSDLVDPGGPAVRGVPDGRLLQEHVAGRVSLERAVDAARHLPSALTTVLLLRMRDDLRVAHSEAVKGVAAGLSRDRIELIYFSSAT